MNYKDNYKEFTLSNGLRVVSYRMDSVMSVFLNLYVHVGAVYERQSERGLSHFVEHTAFLGTVKYQTPLDLSQKQEELGARFGAMTGTSDTTYYCHFPYGNLSAGLEFLNQVVFKSIIRKDDVEEEKNVILSEFNDFWHNPERRFSYLAYQKRFKAKGHPYSYRPMGIPETIKKFDRNALLDWKQLYYHPANMVLSVSGNFEEKPLSNALERFFGGESPAKRVEEPKFGVGDYSNFTLFHQTDPRPQISFQISFPAFGWKPISRRKRLALGILDHILGSGVASRIVQRLRERERLMYRIGSARYLHTWLGDFLVMGSVNATNLVKACKAIREEIDKVVAGDIKQEEIDLSKRYLNSRDIMYFDNPENVAGYIGIQAAGNEKVWFPERYAKESKNVTKQELLSLAGEIFDYNKVNINLLGNIPPNIAEEVGSIFRF